MSNECAVDLVPTIESSTRTVTSGRAMQSELIFSTMSAGSSTDILAASSDSGFTNEMMPCRVPPSPGSGYLSWVKNMTWVAHANSVGPSGACGSQRATSAEAYPSLAKCARL